MNKFRVLVVFLVSAYATCASAKSLTTESLPNLLGNPINEASVWLNQTIYPDGKGLPVGNGTYQSGMVIYQKQCIACHGEGGKGGAGGALVAPILTKEAWAKSPRPSKHVGQYWPYATTLFDYIRRAMPYQAPGTLSNDEVYSLVSYLLAEQKLISYDFIVNAQTLPAIKMPNRDGFTKK